MGEGVVVVPYDPEWPRRFRSIGQRVRRELGPVAVRIDHIGSTAVPGLDAKPIVDVQVSVASFEPLDALVDPMERAGYVFRPGAELTKRYFREQAGQRRTHIHIRRVGSFNEQFALLFRAYLRARPERAAEYGALKHLLAAKFGAAEQRHDYVMAKAPFIWDTMRAADEWAGETGWEPPPSDC